MVSFAWGIALVVVGAVFLFFVWVLAMGDGDERTIEVLGCIGLSAIGTGIILFTLRILDLLQLFLFGPPTDIQPLWGLWQATAKTFEVVEWAPEQL
jgi:hypothetical protein